MKKSIAYLPKNKQKDLNFLVEQIKERLPQTVMVILYGSYARNEYVDHDERDEHGIPTIKISDYDILVVTSGIGDKRAGTVLDNIEDMYFRGKNVDMHTPVQFINDDIGTLNTALEEGRYFYTQIKEEGVMLYDSGKFKLTRKRKLNYTEIRQQAQEYFEEKFNRANEFLIDAKNSYNRGSYIQSSFYLHQACENYYYTIRLTFTLKNSKQHNLAKLSDLVRSYSSELIRIFPRHTSEEKRLFNLIKAAYVDARYNPHFVVTKEDIDTLLSKVETLRDITQRISEEKIRQYGEMK